MVDTFRQAVRILHLDHRKNQSWIPSVGVRPLDYQQRKADKRADDERRAAIQFAKAYHEGAVEMRAAAEREQRQRIKERGREAFKPAFPR
jgi:hypothetical protein